MKLSQLIGDLIAIKNEHGDLDVFTNITSTNVMGGAKEANTPTVTNLKIPSKKEQYKKFYCYAEDKVGEKVVRIS